MPQRKPVKKSDKPTVVFIGSECYPFVKTGGLGDVMYALPKALVQLGWEVRVLIPDYRVIKPEHKEKMVYRGSFYMDLTTDCRQIYVGIMEHIADGVIYDFIDNEEFFTAGNPYTTLGDDVHRFCYFCKASLAALNYMEVAPDIIHCHDWQAGLIPIYLKTTFKDTPVGKSKSVITIHNLRFQGVHNVPHMKYWSNLPDSTFGYDAMLFNDDANMFKGGIAYADLITTVSETYAKEIQTAEYGEMLESHLQYHKDKLVGIVNGIDVNQWDPANDNLIAAKYSTKNAIEGKDANKLALQKELGLDEGKDKFIVGLISRLTNQKGLDLVSAVVDDFVDDNTQFVVLGTGDAEYEEDFREAEKKYPGKVSAQIMYDEALSHKIYAAVDVLLVPSKFEPCGLTQLIAMRYGTAPVVRETGGLKDTVEPFDAKADTGNGFTFVDYDAEKLLGAITDAKDLFNDDRAAWDRMVVRNMEKDVSWTASAQKYDEYYKQLLGK